MSKIREIGQRLPPMAVNALKIVGVLLAIALGLFAVAKLAGLVLPFIVAVVIAAIVEPLVRFMRKRLNLSRTVSTVVSLLLVVALLGVGIGLLSAKLVSEGRDFAVNLPGMITHLSSNFDGFITSLDQRYDFIDEGTVTTIVTALDNVKDGLMSQVNSLTRSVWNTATGVPRMIVTFIVTILAVFFIVRDRERIAAAIHKQLPERWIRRAASVRDDLFGALFGYVRALLILMLLTFVELTIGFSLVGVEYAVLMAAIIALLDALPVLGTGTFVVPWALYNILIGGDVPTGIGLLLVFCFVWVVRQLLEPHVVGDQIGIHPLLTLISMYIGMRYMGVFGMILGPITLIVCRNLFGIYSRGRTLREMLYEGIDMPAEEREKSARLAEPEPAPVPGPIERLGAQVVRFFERLLKRGK